MVYAGEEYLQEVIGRIRSCASCFEEDFQRPRLPRYETVSALSLARELGLDVDAKQLRKLLGERKLIRDGHPTPFGRQCGLSERLTLAGDGEKTLREFVVSTRAKEAFMLALSYTRALERSGDGSLKDRIRRIKRWEPSSAQSQAVLLPKLTEDLDTSLRMPISALREHLRLVDHEKYLGTLLRLLDGFNDASTVEDVIRKLWNGLDQVYRGDDPWDAVGFFGICVYATELRRDDVKQPKGPSPLEHRLELIQDNWLPLAQLPIRELMQALCAKLDGTYPLWLSEGSGLHELMQKLRLDAESTPAMAMGRALAAHDQEIAEKLMCVLLLAPITAIAPATAG